MKILLIGPPACGKGTIGRLLSQKLQLPFISGGEILRSINKNDPNYDYVNSHMKKGVLLPSKMASKYYIDRVNKEDCKNGYVLDGWARNMQNLKYFDPNFDYVFFLDISDDTVLKRVTGRRYCKDTGDTINIYTLNENDKKQCPSGYIQRPDDNPETVKKRLQIYYKQTIPVINYYKQKNLLHTINAHPLPQQITDNIIKIINK